MSDLALTSDQANTAEVRAAKVRGWLLAVLIIVPAVIMIGKHPALPTSAQFGAWFTLGDLPQHVKPHVEYMLFVPLSAIVVSFFRLTLGMPVLSLFRPILVAIAFRVMGIPMGLAFLIFVLGSAIVIRPLLKDLHYYARVPVLLSIASTFMVVPLVFTRWWHEMWLQHLAYFPLGLKLVTSPAQLVEAVNAIVERYDQEALVEEYIDGREVCVGLLGNGDDIEVLPMVEQDFSDRPVRLMTWEGKAHKAIVEPRKICPATVLSGETFTVSVQVT